MANSSAPSWFSPLPVNEVKYMTQDGNSGLAACEMKIPFQIWGQFLRASPFSRAAANSTLGAASAGAALPQAWATGAQPAQQHRHRHKLLAKGNSPAKIRICLSLFYIFIFHFKYFSSRYIFIQAFYSVCNFDLPELSVIISSCKKALSEPNVFIV